MKRILPLITAGCFTLLLLLSCKKAIEDKKKDMIMDAMTNGVWIVEQYFEGTNNISGEFLYYEFKFFENGTVTGTKSTEVFNGTWEGNVSNYSITSQFPTATNPLKKLNGVWLIKDSYWDYVEAEMTTSTGINRLHLRKKP
jgi:hypothetical protein